ncbi:sphingosine 1-phosphate receptor 2 isoform X2 [Alligator sinensis]|nr:sphingosine 1-phosphate receptor 2 isoform X2 [Alligator sinensis]
MGSPYTAYWDPLIVQQHYNYTRGTGERRRSPLSDPVSVLIVIVCSLVVVENLLVLAAVWRNQKLHSAMYVFLGNLAASDLLAGVAFLANTLLSGKHTLALTPVAWFIREGSAFAALAASVFSLLAIAIERHVALAQVKPYRRGGGGRMVLLISACWVVALAVAGLPALGWNCLGRLGACSIVLPLYAKDYVVFVVSVFTVILGTIVAIYAHIYCVARSSHAERAGAQSLVLLKTVTIVLGAFIVCWLPAFVVLLLDAACGRLACPVLAQASYFFAFATLNSAVNPLIYTLRSRDMRREILRLLCCWGMLGRGCRAQHCRRPLRSSSSPEPCTHKHDLPTVPIMTAACATSV